MKKVKITILKRTIQEDLAKEYGIDDFPKCPLMEDNAVCDEAWKAIYQYVFALAHGATETFYSGTWIKEPGIAIVCCNDGLRPVIFKLEATDIESK